MRTLRVIACRRCAILRRCARRRRAMRPRRRGRHRAWRAAPRRGFLSHMYSAAGFGEVPAGDPRLFQPAASSACIAGDVAEHARTAVASRDQRNSSPIAAGGASSASPRCAACRSAARRRGGTSATAPSNPAQRAHAEVGSLGIQQTDAQGIALDAHLHMGQQRRGERDRDALAIQRLQCRAVSSSSASARLSAISSLAGGLLPVEGRFAHAGIVWASSRDGDQGAVSVGGRAQSGPWMARARGSVVDDWMERLRVPPTGRCVSDETTPKRSNPFAIVTFGTYPKSRVAGAIEYQWLVLSCSVARKRVIGSSPCSGSTDHRPSHTRRRRRPRWNGRCLCTSGRPLRQHAVERRASTTAALLMK